MSRHSLVALTAAAVASVAALPPTVAVAARAVAASGPAHVNLRHTSLGSILVNGRGRTLYAFTRDSRNRDRCVSTSGCTSVWPVATTSGRPVAGAGVKRSLLGTIRISGGRTQVTYDGHPLYSYTGDTGAGQTDYVGARQFGGTWKAVEANGSMTG